MQITQFLPWLAPFRAPTLRAVWAPARQETPVPELDGLPDRLLRDIGLLSDAACPARVPDQLPDVPAELVAAHLMMSIGPK